MSPHDSQHLIWIFVTSEIFWDFDILGFFWNFWYFWYFLILLVFLGDFWYFFDIFGIFSILGNFWYFGFFLLIFWLFLIFLGYFGIFGIFWYFWYFGYFFWYFWYFCGIFSIFGIFSWGVRDFFEWFAPRTRHTQLIFVPPSKLWNDYWLNTKHLSLKLASEGDCPSPPRTLLHHGWKGEGTLQRPGSSLRDPDLHACKGHTSLTGLLSRGLACKASLHLPGSMHLTLWDF